MFANSMECIHEEEENQVSEAGETDSVQSVDEETRFNSLEESAV